MKNVLWLLLVLLALITTDIVSLRLHPGTSYAFDIGAPDDHNRLRFDGLYEQETRADGVTYRWSIDYSHLQIRAFASIPRSVLVLYVGGLPTLPREVRSLSIWVDDVPYITVPVTTASRRYFVPLPADTLLDGNLDVTLRTETSLADGDPRELGVRLEQLELIWQSNAELFPTGQTVFAQWAMVLTGLAIMWRLALPARIVFTIGAGLVVLAGWAMGRMLFIPTTWEYDILLTATVLCLVASIFPLLRFTARR